MREIRIILWNVKVTLHKTFANPRQIWYNKIMNKQICLFMLNDELLQVRKQKKEFLEQIERHV